MKKFRLRIEYILLLISILNFAATVCFKSMSQNNFILTESKLSLLKEGEEAVEDLKNDFWTLTYFDKGLELQLEKIIEVKSNAQDDGENFLFLVNEFSSSIRKREQHLIFSYDALLYCSLILCFIAGVVIFYKMIVQKNELFKLKTINDQQVKFSRELHDGVAQDLAALKIYLNKSDKEKSDFYADQALKEVRYLIDSMHLDLSKSFGAIVRENLENFETNFGIKSELLIVSDNLEKIDSEVLVELLRVLQEALSNIARHSGADFVSVKITEVGRDLNLIIKDNGKGIDFESLKESSSADGKKHYGLKNIVARVEEIGGKVEFKNEGGSTIAICIENIIR